MPLIYWWIRTYEITVWGKLIYKELTILNACKPPKNLQIWKFVEIKKYFSVQVIWRIVNRVIYHTIKSLKIPMKREYKFLYLSKIKYLLLTVKKNIVRRPYKTLWNIPSTNLKLCGKKDICYLKTRLGDVNFTENLPC